MQLLATEDYYFIKSVKTILKCCRNTSQLSITNHTELALLDDVRMIGDVHCCIGKIVVENIHYLLLVVECTGIAELEYSEFLIHRIDKICALPILRDGFIHNGLFLRNTADGLAKLKNHHKKIVKFVSDKVSTNQKFIDDIVRFINESANFYFCHSANLTLTVQRRSQQGSTKYDSRYFWNRELLKSFFKDDGTPDSIFHEWIVPVIYGYVSQQKLLFDGDVLALFTLISRRSTKRAGVRYLRRGIDEDSNVANFVETEYIIHVFGHCLSYVQVRGSVPVFWGQKGYRFRPPLCIDRPFSESFPVFEKHVRSLIHEYGSPLLIVNLVEQRGRELCLGESYLQHILELNSPDITFISFDFHQKCRALQFHKVADLTNAIQDEINSIGFCWLDKNGQMVRQQNGIIRTNCVDCLDRTNVVQCAISQSVCLIQARKLGLIEPGSDLFENTKVKYMDAMIRVIQGMWADHGDSISKQYAGTNALKGDVTRGGQRKLLGFMKDGYNSASRYYLSHVHDAQRQRIIDALLSGTYANAIDLNANSSPQNDVGLLIDIENKNTSDEQQSSFWYDEDLVATEDDDEEAEYATQMSSTNDEFISITKSDNPFREHAKPDTVQFNATQSDGDGWVLVDALKQRIADSKSKIRIM